MKYLTSDDLRFINKYVVKVRGNEKYLGLEFPKGLNMVTSQPKMRFGNIYLYPTIWQKAAYLLQKITKKHIFKDGNKRTAYMAAAFFLSENGYYLKLPKNTIINLMLSATVSRDSKNEMLRIASFLKKHATKFDKSN